jgi:hypothetical protein
MYSPLCALRVVLCLCYPFASNRIRSHRSERARLVAKLRREPESPATWLAFLQHEEHNIAASGPHNIARARGGVTLFKLYDWATKTVPRSGNSKVEDYLRLWLGYAREQACAPDPLHPLSCSHIVHDSNIIYS